MYSSVNTVGKTGLLRRYLSIGFRSPQFREHLYSVTENSSKDGHDSFFFKVARISSCQNISLVLWLLNHAEVCTTVSASVSLKECKHGSVCPRHKLDGQCADIFILLSLIIKHTCNNCSGVQVRIPSLELRWCLFLCSCVLPGEGKKGSWKANCTPSFPLPPQALYVSKAKMYMHLGRNVCRSRSYQQGGWEGAICSPALHVLLFPGDLF